MGVQKMTTLDKQSQASFQLGVQDFRHHFKHRVALLSAEIAFDETLDLIVASICASVTLYTQGRFAAGSCSTAVMPCGYLLMVNHSRGAAAEPQATVS